MRNRVTVVASLSPAQASVNTLIAGILLAATKAFATAMLSALVELITRNTFSGPPPAIAGGGWKAKDGRAASRPATRPGHQPG